MIMTHVIVITFKDGGSPRVKPFLDETMAILGGATMMTEVQLDIGAGEWKEVEDRVILWDDSTETELAAMYIVEVDE